MKTALHLVWVCVLGTVAAASVHELCAGTVRCEERCGAELWLAAFAVLLTAGLLGWRVIENIARARRWQ